MLWKHETEHSDVIKQKIRIFFFQLVNFALILEYFNNFDHFYQLSSLLLLSLS